MHVRIHPGAPLPDRLRTNPLDVTSLDLTGNGLEVLPEWLGGLSSLTTLHLSGNRLEVLPEWLGGLSSLTSLDLSGNGLEVLPEWLGGLSSLTSLHLSFNGLEVLPDSLGGLSSLTTLNLSFNGLEVLPEWLGGLSSLTSLHLGGNGLKVLPEWLGGLSSLTTLNLNSNRLEVLPEWLGGLSSLTSLHLNSNGLEVLPEWLGGLSSLTSLHLNSNGLEVLPDSLGGLSSLTTLHLNSNRLEVLPDSLGGLSSLTSLHLNSNRLEVLPDSLGGLSSLTSLDLSFNGLEVLPEWLGGLSSLTTLDLNSNGLKVLPDSLGGLSSLTTLHLNSNRLEVLPEWLGGLSSLTSLHLGGNGLEVLPEWLGGLSSLTTLNLNSNRLEVLPEWLGGLSSLTSLHLNGNGLEVLPEWLGGLSSLTTLDLNSNGLKVLPDSLGGLSSLTTLNLNSNRLEVLPDSLGGLSSLTSLHLGGNGLKVLPDSLGGLSSLTTLNLNSNGLEVLPEWLGGLSSLTSLHLGGNGLKVLPDSLGGLSSLTTLDLSFNGLEVLPEWLGGLSSLTTLDLNSNGLEVLPDSLGGLSSLTSLDLNSNGLEVLPDSLGGLSSLTSLDLSFNGLEVLPDSLGGLSSLTTLDLSFNGLEVLPDSLGGLTSLIDLRIGVDGLRVLPTWLARVPVLMVHGSGSSLPPEQRAALAADQVQPFLAALAEDGVVVSEGKLVLVGEGEAGKSTLLAALRDEPFDPDRKVTHGLEVKQVTLGGYRFSAWDFGGQPQYRPSHQLFFSPAALYVVVWRPRLGPQAAQIEYWINLIRHRAGHAVPVLIVATHGDVLDNPAPDIDFTRLRLAYGDTVRAVLQVGSLKRTNFNELVTAIVDAAVTLPHITRTLPRRWLTARDGIGSVPDPYITRQTFLSHTERLGIAVHEAESMIAVGHTLGWWICYDDDPDLRDILVLKGDWLSTAIALVLDDPTTRTHGLLDHTRLPAIWQHPDRPEHLRYPRHLHGMFLQLMEQFDIAYPAPRKPNRSTISVVPQLLPTTTDQLDRVWDGLQPDADTASAVCQPVVAGTTQRAMPEGILPRFIARSHWLSLGSDDLDQAIHWRSGVVLRNRYGARALVTLDADSISITARGPDPAGFLRDLLESLRELIRDFWPGLDPKVLLPCTECGTPRMFDLDQLYARLTRKPTAECNTCLRDVPVDRLLHQLPGTQPDRTDAQLSELANLVGQLIASVNAQVAAGATLNDTMRSSVQELASRLDGTLSVILDAFADDSRHGPRLYTAEPLERTIKNPSVTHIRIRVTLYCEHSKQPVHQLDNDPTKGVIDVDVPKDWWKKSAPWIRRVAAVLSTAAPIAKEVLRLSFDDPGWKGIEEPTGLGRELIVGSERSIKALTAGTDTHGVDDLDDDPTVFIPGPIQAEGGDLRRLHALLRERDPSFGDLRLVRAPTTGYLWVHRTFEHHYKSAVPTLPTT